MVVELQHLAHIGAQWRIGSEFEQPAMVLRQLQLACRAQHAEAIDTAQLADADLERLAICLVVIGRRQFGADQGQRHANAHPRVRRTANDLQQSSLRVLTGIDLAHAQLVGAGVLHHLDDLSHHDARERRRHGAQRFDLHARHRQQLGQSVGR